MPDAMYELIVQWGLPALFGISFLAATILPVASEWLLVALIAGNANLPIAVAVATTGNTLGAITTWSIGMWGGTRIITDWLRIKENDRLRAQRWYRRWGSWSLLMAWAPVIGDPLCLAGGLLKVPFWRFALLTAAGKAARYGAVAWAAHGLTSGIAG